jgi:phosphatidylserine/phosphatidylglycerophosphate/cardiolipin synthase-like enzyme
MNKVLTATIWREAKRQARASTSRKLAVAYVTKDHIGMRAGDVLVTDASLRAIKSGQTDAKLLARLFKKGVSIYSHEGLHSKVMLLGNYAVVGSANMSGSDLTEAAVLTDDPAITSGVASFIAQLATTRSLLDGKAIAALCKIVVVRTGWSKKGRKAPVRIGRLGNSTWIVGVYDLVRDPPPDEQRLIDRANSEINQRLGSNAEYEWIRWEKKSKFAKECRAGDTLIKIFNEKKGNKRTVTRRLPVLLKRSEPKWVRFYLGEPAKTSDEITWSKFQRVLREVGYTRKVVPRSIQRLKPEIAVAIDQNWMRVRLKQ